MSPKQPSLTQLLTKAYREQLQDKKILPNKVLNKGQRDEEKLFESFSNRKTANATAV